MRAKLSSVEIEEGLCLLNQESPREWCIDNGMLHIELIFGDFVGAFDFMTKVAALAQEMNHHPNWTNVYSKVNVNLTTHDSGGLTSLDFELAHKINNVLRSV